MPKIKSVRVNKAGPISGLHVSGIPESARLVVLIGPNGSGKTSLLDAFAVNEKGGKVDLNFDVRPVDIEFYNKSPRSNLHLYIRSASRAEYSVGIYGVLLVRPFSASERPRGAPSHRTPDQRVTKNFEALLHQAHQISAKSHRSWEEAVTELFSPLNKRLNSIFPYLTISKIEYPTGPNNADSLETLCFQKSGVRYQYAGLSAGEKEIFDLLFDLEMCAKDYPDALYCIDEPELHLHAELQGKLLVQLLDFLPEQSQLWIATHSAGIIRKAIELNQSRPGEIAFLNFRDLQSGTNKELRPSTVDRSFGREVLRVALNDMVDLLSPDEVVICEGHPRPANGNSEFDAKAYRVIFASSHPGTDFISAGNCNDVIRDSIKLRAALEFILPGVRVSRLIDHDNRDDEEINKLRAEGCRVLPRYSIENYLWSDEILQKLMDDSDCSSEQQASILEVNRPIVDGSPQSPLARLKSISGQLYEACKRIPSLKGKGRNRHEFALNCLVPLITPGTVTYTELEKDIFQT